MVDEKEKGSLADHQKAYENGEYDLGDLLVEEDEAERNGQNLGDSIGDFIVTDDDVPYPSGEGIPNHRASGKPLLRGLRGGKIADKKVRATKPKANIPKRKGMFIGPLTNLYTSIGIALMTVDQQCGETIIKSAENCAKALDDLAYQNDSVRRAVWAITQTSVAGAVILAHAPILVSVMLHHAPGISARLGNFGTEAATEAAERAANQAGENAS